MKKTFRYLTALLALLAVGAVMGSCTPNPPADTSDSTTGSDTAAVTEEAKMPGGFDFVFKGGAKLENGAIVGTKGAEENIAYCEDIGTTEACVDLTVKLTGTTTGGISFKYKDDEHRYFIGFDKRNQRIRLTCYNGDEIIVVGTYEHPLESDEEIKIRLAFRGSMLKMFVDDWSEDAYPAFDIPIKMYRNKGLLIDLGSGTLQVTDIEVSEYTYLLSSEERYMNPIATGADPYILQHEGKYYMYSTNAPTEGYKVYESSDLVKWTDKGFCLRNGDVYGSPTSSQGFWAPEVYFIEGRFYMFYTVHENIGVAVADSPLGPFKKHSEGFLFPGKRAIDANLFIDDDGQMYLYYVISNNGNDIYGAKFDLKTLTVSEERLIISPTANTWEWVGDAGRVAEGPCMLKHNGHYYLTYSANGYPSHDYAVGYAVSSSPLSGFERFEGNPILSKSIAAGVFGPGHHSFMTSAGGELFIVYHRHKSESEVHSRTTCIDRCTFEPQENGPDKLVVHGPTSTPQKRPE